MQIIGRYQVEAEVGRGAMGVVFRAVDPAIGRTVAIKTIRLSEFADQAECADMRERFAREARVVGNLSHPGIVTIHDVGRQGDFDYIVMEFVHGTTLEKMLAGNVPQSTETLLRILRQAAEALDFAHARGVVHRDIKPANIMLNEDGRVKITDFGVAKLSAASRVTRTGFTVGTPHYMAPEQIQGGPIDGRADQFSLAVMAYEMLTGQRPFDGATLTAVIYNIIWTTPVEPQKLNPRLGPQVERALFRALSKKAEDRHESCMSFVWALEQACRAGKVPIEAPAEREPLPTPAAAETIPAVVTPEAARAAVAAGPPGKPTRWRRTAVAFAVGVMLVAAGLGVTWRSLWKPAPVSPPAAQPASPAQAEPPAMFPEPGGGAPPAAPQAGQPGAGQASLPVAPPPVKQAPGAGAPKARPEPPPASPGESPLFPMPAERAAPEGPPPNQQPVFPTPAPESPRTDPSPPQPPRVAVEERPVGVPSRAPAAAVPAGTIIWSGRLDRESLLVIDGKHASRGTVSTSLPGVPVSIEVEPADIEVRTMPGPENGWRRLVLSSGDKRYSAIKIHWRLRR